jgi:hypothetical protein
VTTNLFHHNESALRLFDLRRRPGIGESFPGRDAFPEV